MYKIARVLCLVALVLSPLFLYSQFNNNTTSPFSRFGLGDLQPLSFGRTAAMGGAVFGSRYPGQINFANPASYTCLDTLSFIFELGFNGKFANYRNAISNLNTNDINFRYFSLAFRITDWMATSLALAPYSDVGYEVLVDQEISASNNANYSYYGRGSLSRAYIGLAIEPFRNFAIGSNLYYFFGNLSKTSEVAFPQSTDSYAVQQFEQIRLRDFGLNFGLQYTRPTGKDEGITLGIVLENKPTFTGFNSDLTIRYLSSSQSTDIDTISYINEEKDKIRLPLSYGAGITWNKKNKMEISLDYFHQAWSKAEFFGQTDPILTNLNRFSLGGEYIPDRFSIRSKLKRMSYRAGLKYEKSYLLINDQPLNDFGISFGVGLPVYRSNSTVNISAETGKRGRTSVNLIRENYFKFNLAVNIYDLWFIKRRFD